MNSKKKKETGKAPKKDFISFLFNDVIGQTELDFDLDSLLESEKEVNREYISYEIDAKPPFDPSLIRVDFRQMPLDLILRRIERNELDLNPEFQRESSIWNQDAQSRLIESLLIKIPLPVFFIDASEDDKWLIVDGLQRLSTFKKFILTGELKLQGLEFLRNLNGFSFHELPRNYQRRIMESLISIYLIEKGTPKDVKLSIFKRINTGGLPLSDQEIRHALYSGQASRFLNEIVNEQVFISVTDGGIRSSRMADRECVLRFFAFSLQNYSSYSVKDFDGFLNDTMELLGKISKEDLSDLKQKFIHSMSINYKIFGKDAFRKRYKPKAPRNPINRALFETFSVLLSDLNENQEKSVLKNKEILKDKFMELMKDQEFEDSISSGTSEVFKVHYRFKKIEDLIKEVLNENSKN